MNVQQLLFSSPEDEVWILQGRELPFRKVLCKSVGSRMESRMETVVYFHNGTHYHRMIGDGRPDHSIRCFYATKQPQICLPHNYRPSEPCLLTLEELLHH